MYSYTNFYLTQIATAIIPATDGTPTLASTFGDRLCSGPGCEHLGDYTSPPTKRRTVEFTPLEKSGSSTEIWNSFKLEGAKVEFEKLGLTLAQFCVGKEYFRGGDLVLIKIEAEGQGQASFFVAHVFVDDDGALSVRVDVSHRGRVWRADDRHRVVVPQPDPATP